MTAQRWGTTEDQEAFVEAVREAAARLDRTPTTGDVRRTLDGLGWRQLLVPEADGGVGAGLLETTMALEELGRRLLPDVAAPEIVAGAATRLLDGPLRDAMAGQLAGDTPVSVLLGDGLTVADGRLSGSIVSPWEVGTDGSWLLATTDAGLSSLVWVESLDRVETVTVPSLDATRPRWRVRIDSELSAHRIADTGGGLGRLRDVYRLCLAADSVGAGQACLDGVMEHVRGREQFGRSIGSFQAVKHRVVDIHMALSLARHLLHEAARATQDGRADAHLLTLAASVKARRAFVMTAESAVQLHGGMGFTAEADPARFLMRSRFNARALASDGADLDEIAALLREGVIPEWW